MRISTSILLFFISIAGAFQPVDPDMDAPQDVRLEWISPTHARMTWDHQSRANYWAVSKAVTWGHVTIAESFVSAPGEVTILMAPRMVEQLDYSPQESAQYYIQIAERDPGSHATTWVKFYGPYALDGPRPYWRLLPIVRR